MRCSLSSRRSTRNGRSATAAERRGKPRSGQKRSKRHASPQGAVTPQNWTRTSPRRPHWSSCSTCSIMRRKAGRQHTTRPCTQAALTRRMPGGKIGTVRPRDMRRDAASTAAAADCAAVVLAAELRAPPDPPVPACGRADTSSYHESRLPTCAPCKPEIFEGLAATMAKSVQNQFWFNADRQARPRCGAHVSLSAHILITLLMPGDAEGGEATAGPRAHSALHRAPQRRL